jgi:hypothetical protein
MPDSNEYLSNKYYKIEKKRQESFKNSEKELDREYKKVLKEESRQEGLNRLHPEDSTVESEFKKGGVVGRGQGQAYKIKTTRLF